MSQRFLTEEEIKNILQSIRPIIGLNRVVGDEIVTRMKQKIYNKLQQIKIYPEKIEKLKIKIIQQYHNSQIVPGDSVGIATAQSIGERQTQLALNSFHSTGITTATVVSGVPRFNELVNATKNPKNVITTIYPKVQCDSIQNIRKYTSEIKHIIFRQLITSYKLHVKSEEDEWYILFKKVYPQKTENIFGCTYYIRIHCDIQQMYLYKIHLKDITKILEIEFEDVHCCWSPNSIGIIDIWIEKKVNDNIQQFMDDILIPTIGNLTIKGIDGIEDINYNKNNKEWFIEAIGYNLKKIFALPFIDMSRTISNHMWEIYDVLGIEATREFLIQEFMSVISVDSYVNIRHVQLLVDVMLYTGSISSISRYGVHKNQSGALTKCSFEESLDQFLKAGIYGENEDITGVSGAIICGKISNIGSGLCDLVYSNEEE